jgi:hypothetical protein
LTVGTVPRDRVVASAVRQLAQGGGIARSHMSADNLPDLTANGIKRLNLHVRDPRQVVVSWVHHIRRMSDAEFHWSALRYDPPIPAEFRRWHLLRQLDWAVYNYLPGQLQWLEDWAAALDRGPAIPVLLSRFEDFVHDRHSFFDTIWNFLGISGIRVPSLRWQSAATMRNFRIGSTDEWREVLSATQMRSFEDRIEPLAKYFGWKLHRPARGVGRVFDAATAQPACARP